MFIGVSDREKERGNQRQLKETQRITEDLQNYNDWLRIAGWYIVCSAVYFALNSSELLNLYVSVLAIYMFLLHKFTATVCSQLICCSIICTQYNIIIFGDISYWSMSHREYSWFHVCMVCLGS